MKLEIDIHPAAEKPNRSGWFIILDRAGRWRRSYYDRRDMYWDPRDITYWAEMPDETRLARTMSPRS